MNGIAMDALINDPRYLVSNRNVVWSLIRTLDDPSAAPGKIPDLINQDQALVARVLRLANAPFFGLSRHVTSVHDAVLVLGLMNVRRLAIGVSFLTTEEPVLGQFWLRSFRRAYVCECLCDLSGVPGETGFVAGLLWDIGLLLMFGHNASYGEKLHALPSALVSLAAEENENFGFNHAQLAARLARQWHFPESLTTLIEARFETVSAESELSLQTLNLADLWLSECASLSLAAAEEHITQKWPPYWSIAGLDAQRLAEAMIKADERARSLAS